MTSSDNIKTYTGSCHCGFLRYSIDIDLAEPKATKCNCSICLKLNILSLKIEPPSTLTLISPPTKDDPLLGNYTHGSKSIHFYFCKTCGVSAFYEGKYVTLDGTEVYTLNVNAVTLDPDQGIDLRQFKVQYWDGKASNWAAGARDEPYPGGSY
ncbi:hypothetical protein K469DRAFT_668928 [Zopfia rhizophila CBS 207.26]|uniref:CENP-V/GFA domain-containing protein n=1 Tax=Zopfia rhizophila CBS 207.26 TaxID=1314779 RepID=A0A6A6DTM9_9PEZI|nr:hypothetical protein K469DRAFT_668928 [Zopfia rhizophila CBS 207.26]